VIGKVSLLAVQKFSSNVMEKCLERSGDRVQELYLQEISHPDKVRELRQGGKFVMVRHDLYIEHRACVVFVSRNVSVGQIFHYVACIRGM